MLRWLFAALAVVLFCAGPAAVLAAAQPPADPAMARAHELLDKMVGRWVLAGKIAGQDTVHDVGAAWVLNQSYVSITEVSREKDAGGKPQYEAIVLIGWLKDHYVCFWFDNTEVASGEVTCRAKDASDSIAFEFRDGKGALIFLNTFTYRRAAGTWQWEMSDPRDGKTFGAVTLSPK